MLPEISKIKGLHPGEILKRELKIRNLKSSALAISIDEHKQTISAILNKRRDINPKLSIKLAQQLDVEQDYFMMLQASYNVKIAADAETNSTPDLSKIRKALFWDSTLDKIDWNKNKKAVIQRVLERGNETEINEIVSFYGKESVTDIVKSIESRLLAAFEKNVREHDLI